jgi:hypothetical protein
MRWGIIFAALGALVSALSASAAKADGWCGYAARAKAMVECGYSTAAECENAIGKGGMCFIDPEYASNAKRNAPATAAHANAPALAAARS